MLLLSSYLLCATSILIFRPTTFTVNNRDCKEELLPVSDGNLVDFRYETQALVKQVDPSKKLAELPA